MVAQGASPTYEAPGWPGALLFLRVLIRKGTKIASTPVQI